MTPQEALEALKIKQIEINGNAVRIGKFFEGIAVANDALEKQIPKKPLYIEGDYDMPLCPNCRLSVDENEIHCSVCGQALDMGNFEKIKPTNYDRLRNMSVKEIAIEHIYFIPDHKKFHYTGLSGLYTKTAEETIQNNTEWLESEVDTNAR